MNPSHRRHLPIVDQATQFHEHLWAKVLLFVLGVAIVSGVFITKVRAHSQQLGWNHDWFGTARAPLTALWTPESICYIQVFLVVVGHLYGIYVAQRETSRIYLNDRRAGLYVHIIMMIAMVMMSMLSLWLLAQPMCMRTAELQVRI